MQACEAYKSFNEGTNPGFVKLSPGIRYDAVEVNKPQWDWVRIEVPEVDEPLRWVPKGCGEADVTFDTDQSNSGQQCNIKNQHDSYVLAITWQPGFCEHYSYSGEKPECDAMQTEELVVHHLTLHGLWPNREQCGINYGRCTGPELNPYARIWSV
jgi:ribonuclease T2